MLHVMQHFDLYSNFGAECIASRFRACDLPSAYDLRRKLTEPRVSLAPVALACCTLTGGMIMMARLSVACKRVGAHYFFAIGEWQRRCQHLSMLNMWADCVGGCKHCKTLQTLYFLSSGSEFCKHCKKQELVVPAPEESAKCRKCRRASLPTSGSSLATFSDVGKYR